LEILEIIKMFEAIGGSGGGEERKRGF